ncbi:MAG: DUF3445 domain-containing protein, partial [Pseudomonadota bacterium]
GVHRRSGKGGRALSVGAPRYLPFKDPVKGKPPGLFALDPATWVEVDETFREQMAQRDRLLGSSPELTLGCLRSADAAVGELVAALTRHLTSHKNWQMSGDSLRRPDGVAVALRPAVETLGRMTQEDWLILQDLGGPEYVLTAGALCFPGNWALPDKLGKPLTQVHDPVPGYTDALAARVNRVFEALHVDRPLQRLNWSLAKTDALHCPRPHESGAPLYLRVERQTLVRLPQTEAVVFGIKTYLTSLEALDLGDHAELHAACLALTPQMREYKGIPDVGPS